MSSGLSVNILHALEVHSCSRPEDLRLLEGGNLSVASWVGSFPVGGEPGWNRNCVAPAGAGSHNLGAPDFLDIALMLPRASSSRVHYSPSLLAFDQTALNYTLMFPPMFPPMLERHGKRQKSHMKMFNTVSNTLSPHFNISEVEVF